MADLMDLFQGQLGNVLAEQAARTLGIEDKNQAEHAVDSTISTLLNAISRNVATTDGASGLAGALDRDHDGSILDDVVGFLGGTKQAQNTSMLNGAGILKHVLGGQQNVAVEMLGKLTGLDKSKNGQLMMMLAPVVLGMLGKQKKENKLDQTGLADLVVRGTENYNRRTPTDTDFITKILDKDGDGSAMDEIASFGMKTLFGKLFK